MLHEKMSGILGGMKASQSGTKTNGANHDRLQPKDTELLKSSERNLVQRLQAQVSRLDPGGSGQDKRLG